MHVAGRIRGLLEDSGGLRWLRPAAEPPDSRLDVHGVLETSSAARAQAALALAQSRLLVVVAGGLGCVAFALHALTDASDAGAICFAAAVVLVAVAAGPVAGTLAALGACGLDAGATAIAGGHVDLLDVAGQVVPLVLIGAGIGRLASGYSRGAEEIASARQETEDVEATFRAVFENALDAVLIFDDDGRILDANGAVASVVGAAREELIGDRIGERAPPESKARLAELRRAFEADGAMRGEYEFTSRDGARRSVEFTAAAHFLPGRHLTVIRDCTERKRGHAALEQLAAEHALIADLALLALAGSDGSRLADEIADRLAAALHVDYVSILERIPPGDELLLRAGTGWREGLVGHARLRVQEEPMAARALAGADPVMPADVGPEARSRLLRDHGVASGACVAIRGSETPYGVLCVYMREARSFTREEIDFLRVVANTAAMAIERGGRDLELRRASEEIARLAAERQRIVAEALDAEDRARERISQQLHDGLLQSLFVIRQDLAELAGGSVRPDLAVRARDGVHEAIRELRAAVFDLHPVVLDLGGLRSAVGAVARHHAALGGFEVGVEIGPDADGEYGRLLLSLARELLSNAAQHAGARHAGVAIRRTDGELVLEVSDDGCGVDPARVREAVAQGHIGLASAAQRVEVLGGRFELHDRPGGGTLVRAAIPIGDGLGQVD